MNPSPLNRSKTLYNYSSLSLSLNPNTNPPSPSPSPSSSSFPFKQLLFIDKEQSIHYLFTIQQNDNISYIYALYLITGQIINRKIDFLSSLSSSSLSSMENENTRMKRLKQNNYYPIIDLSVHYFILLNIKV